MNTKWFEMADLKKHIYNNKVWVPLYAQNTISKTGDALYSGFCKEYFGAHSVIVPKGQKDAALNLDWMDLSLGYGHKPWVDNDSTFHPADGFDSGTVTGLNPILVQYLEIERRDELHVHQDIELGLGLTRVRDTWVCPEEDYIEVIRLRRNEEGNPIQVDIRAEFLKDYLCAANYGLVLLTYQSRQAIQESFDDLKWADEETKEETDRFRWSGRLLPVREGNLFSQAVHVIHAGRTDTDYSEDIPVYGFPTDGTTYSNSWTVDPSGRELVRAMGEIWKIEWIGPAAKSPRVRGDKIESKLEFVVDNEGNKETSNTLTLPSRWLWFHPNVINDLLKKRTGVISWYTEETGSVGGAWNRAVHFGVNSIGFINVYAKDIAHVREADKKVWANHNVSPEGGMSAELLMSQMQAVPADTIAPEHGFFLLVEQIQKIARERLGGDLFRGHSLERDISRRIHRFQAVTLEGFFLLCKEITRYLVERIDMDLLKRLKKEEDKLGSLKRFENILTALGYDGRQITGVLVGVYELRMADAHLPSASKIEEAMKLVGVDYEEAKWNSGKKLIESVNGSLAQIKEAFETGDFSKVK